jgi:hypothetical protein
MVDPAASATTADRHINASMERKKEKNRLQMIGFKSPESRKELGPILQKV